MDTITLVLVCRLGFFFTYSVLSSGLLGQRSAGPSLGRQPPPRRLTLKGQLNTFRD